MEIAGNSSLSLLLGVWSHNSGRERESLPQLLPGLSQGRLRAPQARWETCQGEPRSGGLSPEHFQMEGGLLPRGCGTHDGMQGKIILGLYMLILGCLGKEAKAGDGRF